MTKLDPIEWCDTFRTGVEDIDSQHKVLLTTLNGLSAGLSDPFDARAFDEVIRGLLAYAIFHFETEEQLMKRHGYDLAESADAAAHVRAHRDFSAHMVNMRHVTLKEHVDAREVMLSFLYDWLLNHISGTDQRLASFILAHPTLTSPLEG